MPSLLFGFATLLISLTANAATNDPSAFHVVGYAFVEGAALQDCSTLAVPKSSDAEENANAQAATNCADQGLGTPTRVSEFVYSTNNCVWRGPGYRYPFNQVWAEAQYRCN